MHLCSLTGWKSRRVLFVYLKIREEIEESSCQRRKLMRKLTKRSFDIKRKGINTELNWKLLCEFTDQEEYE